MSIKTVCARADTSNMCVCTKFSLKNVVIFSVLVLLFLSFYSHANNHTEKNDLTFFICPKRPELPLHFFIAKMFKLWRVTNVKE